MEFIDQFEKHYDYDCNYMRKMAQSNPQAFETFVNFLPMGQVGKSLPVEVLWTAKISSMLTEDCGACVQLNIKMALEAGVTQDLVKMIVQSPEKLSADLSTVYNYARSVSLNIDTFYQYQNKIQEQYSQEQITELALAIASTKIYPTVKRALGDFKSCSLYEFEF